MSHKAGRNVWLVLWETALQAPQLLSRPRGLEFCHTGLNGWRAGRDWDWLFPPHSFFFFFTPRWQTVRGCETKTRTLPLWCSLTRSPASFPSLCRHLNDGRAQNNWRANKELSLPQVYFDHVITERTTERYDFSLINHYIYHRLFSTRGELWNNTINVSLLFHLFQVFFFVIKTEKAFSLSLELKLF